MMEPALLASRNDWKLLELDDNLLDRLDHI